MRTARLAAAICIVSLVAGIGSAVAGEDSGPVQLAFFTPYQLLPEDKDVSALRLNMFYSKNRDLKGLDIGCGLNRLEGDMTGLSGSFVNIIEGDVVGWQSAGFAKVGGSLKGLQSGIVTWAEHDVGGVQWGALNFCRGEIHGLQIGLVNKSESVRGLQFGLLNMTVYLKGVQIGVLNVATGKRMMKYLPLVNASF